jgi:hypothetical protein
MISCYECPAEISDQARACPKCGAPSRSIRKSDFFDENVSLKVFCLISFLASLMLLILGIVADAEDKEAYNEWKDCKSIYGDGSSIGGPCHDEMSNSLSTSNGGGFYFFSGLCFIAFLTSIGRLKKIYM